MASWGKLLLMWRRKCAKVGMYFAVEALQFERECV